jgi:hypothetical protein
LRNHRSLTRAVHFSAALQAGVVASLHLVGRVVGVLP